MVLHLNYKTTNSSLVIQRRKSLSGELHSKILTNSLNDSKMKRLWVILFVVLIFSCEDKESLEADFYASANIGSRPLEVKFFDDSSPYNTAIEWSWSFGDGSFSKEQNPTHIYNKMGDYTVELTVKDGNDYSIERKENFINVEGAYLVELVGEITYKVYRDWPSMTCVDLIYTLKNVGDFKIGGWNIGFQALTDMGIQGVGVYSSASDYVRFTSWMEVGQKFTSNATAKRVSQIYGDASEHVRKMREEWATNVDTIIVSSFEVVNPN